MYTSDRMEVNFRHKLNLKAKILKPSPSKEENQLSASLKYSIGSASFCKSSPKEVIFLIKKQLQNSPDYRSNSAF